VKREESGRTPFPCVPAPLHHWSWQCRKTKLTPLLRDR